MCEWGADAGAEREDFIPEATPRPRQSAKASICDAMRSRHALVSGGLGPKLPPGVMASGPYPLDWADRVSRTTASSRNGLWAGSCVLVHKRKICSPPTSSVGLPTRFFNYFFQKIKEVLRLEDARRTSLSVHSKEKDREQTDLICCSLTQHRDSSRRDYHDICAAIEISFSINKRTRFSK